MARQLPQLKYEEDYPGYTPGGGGEGSRPDEWIRYFSAEATRIRIAPMERPSAKTGEPVYGTRAWPQGFEHYSQMARYFPCFDDLGYVDNDGNSVPCPGCASNQPEEVRRRVMRWYFQAVDEEGEYRVFKTGPDLFEMLQGREQRYLAADPGNVQPLSDRDFVIVKTGTKRKPSYHPEAEDKYEYQFDASRYHDIQEMRFAAADQANAIYSGQAEPLGEADTAEEEPRRGGRIPQKQQGVGVNEPAPSGGPDAGESNGAPLFQTADDITEAETEDIRTWLKAKNIEYAKSAPRPRLVKIAKDYLAQNPPF